MPKRPTRRQALYFPSDMLQELQGEAARQERSISWLIQTAWKVARTQMQQVPSTTDLLEQITYSADVGDAGEQGKSQP